MVINRLLRSVVNLPLLLPLTVLTVGATTLSAQAQDMYNPIELPEGYEITDTLTDKDIPTGFGGFARDYVVTLSDGDYVVIDLTSDEFDTIISLLAPDGSTLSENDDGPDGTTNSMLFARITRTGEYVLRVRPYAGQGTGVFNLKVTLLRPIN